MKKNYIAFTILLLCFSFAKANQPGKINVEVVNKAKLSKIIKERNGKPLFLNLWATWCQPCREEFPTIVKLSNELKNVDFVNISVDFPDEVNSKIIPFLKMNNVDFPSYVNGFSGDEELINALDKNWNGALPATFIYDKHGVRQIFLSGKKSYDEFKKEIEKVMKK